MADTPLEEQKLLAEIENLRASKRKAVAEARNAEQQAKENKKQRSVILRFLSTTQATVVLALVTLLSQIVQFGCTARANRDADEAKQWKETVRDVDFKGEEKTVGAAMNVETFLTSANYSEQAKALLASLVVYVKNDNAFDNIFSTLLGETNWSDKSIQIYGVAKAVSLAYGVDADMIPIYVEKKNSNLSPSLWGRYHEELSNVLLELGKTEQSPDVIEAKRREWEIDTTTHGLVDFWQKKGTKPHNLFGFDTSYPADLQGVILRYDGDSPVDLSDRDFQMNYLKGAYLSNTVLKHARLDGAVLEDVDMERADLTGASLDGARVSGANLSKVTKFDGSSWKGVEWWLAARISPELCAYLQTVRQHGGSVAACAVQNETISPEKSEDHLPIDER